MMFNLRKIQPKLSLVIILIAEGLILSSCGKGGVNPAAQDSVKKVAAQSLTVSTLPFNGAVGNLALDAAGNLYVNGEESYTIQKVTPAGVQTTLTSVTAGSSGLAVDAGGNVYSTSNNFINKTTPDGNTINWVKIPNVDLYAVTAQTSGAGAGNIYASDGFSGAVYQANSAGVSAGFAISQGGISHCIAVDGNGNVYMGSQFAKIYKITPNGTVTVYAGTGTNGAADGPAAKASFNGITGGIAIDKAGDLFIADSDNHKIRMISAAGVVSTIAGTGTSGYVDGPVDKAAFSYPTAIAVNSAGTVLYVADYGDNHIRKITLSQ
jgi:hypothetical protein